MIVIFSLPCIHFSLKTRLTRVTGILSKNWNQIMYPFLNQNSLIGINEDQK